MLKATQDFLVDENLSCARKLELIRNVREILPPPTHPFGIFLQSGLAPSQEVTAGRILRGY